MGTLTSDITRYNEWKSIDGEAGYKKNYAYKLDVLLEGLLKPERLLDVIKNNLFFMNSDKEKPVKILSQYHQYFGVKKAYASEEIFLCKKKVSRKPFTFVPEVSNSSRGIINYCEFLKIPRQRVW